MLYRHNLLSQKYQNIYQSIKAFQQKKSNSKLLLKCVHVN